MADYSNKRIGVVLAGSGVYDGSEIHEAVITLLTLDEAGSQIVCMAPDINQMHVIDHTNGEQEEGESRNVLKESARIARGEITDIGEPIIEEEEVLLDSDDNKNLPIGEKIVVFLTFHSRCSQEESLFISFRKATIFFRRFFITKAIRISQNDDIDSLVGLLI